MPGVAEEGRLPGFAGICPLNGEIIFTRGGMSSAQRGITMAESSAYIRLRMKNIFGKLALKAGTDRRRRV
jgi:hypothetical protein